MNAKSKSPVLFPLSLILLVGFTVLEINLAYATPIVRLRAYPNINILIYLQNDNTIVL